MTETHLEKTAALMRGLDICQLVTFKNGAMAGRPMSNNGEVDYDGSSWFFTWDDAGMVSDIKADPRVAITFQKNPGLLAGAPMHIHIQGTAEIIHDKAAFEEHWTSGLERWFKDGVDTPGLVLIHVQASRLAYWDGEEQGDFAL